jgi:hypothetical protein
MSALVQISETQSKKATTANENFSAVAPAGLFGAKLSECVGLTWAYYGGYMMVNNALVSVAAGTIALNDDAVNYLEADTAGVVHIATGSPAGFTAGRIPLYIVTVVGGYVVNASTIDARAVAPAIVESNFGGPKKWLTHLALTSLTDGTDATPANGTRNWCSLWIPHRVTLTGIGYLIGTVGGTDKVIVELKDNTGANVANSALAGATVGTLATFQQVAFTSTISVERGWYYVVTQFNGATARFRTIPANLGISQVAITGSVAGTFGTLATITPGTTFTADLGPIAYVY